MVAEFPAPPRWCFIPEASTGQRRGGTFLPEVTHVLPPYPTWVPGLGGRRGSLTRCRAEMDPLRAQQLAAELEVEMMADMYNRMTSACHRKCVPPHYKEAELSKGESVCLDRCVSKYLDIHERMGKKLTELSMQDEELMKRVQQGSGPA
ncbi:mitochondrial import inner membrane translocase subunit Tim10 isoform X1 [Camelus dromedarius]|uniref:Mitochondrial import inner membrane translocase subunit Tim10 isoform X1 n=6 Tax=Laurasiatheria TaxID=314145 RepID=A0A9W3ELK1_CAMBA